MPWTEPELDILKFLWANGKTAEEIADTINDKFQRKIPITRNAIIGKVHRLGLSGRAAPVKSHKRKFYGGGEAQVSNHKRVSSRGLNGKFYLPPCWRLRRFAQFIFPLKAYLNVYGPLFDDIQFEYTEALNKEHIRLARWIVIRGYISFFTTIAAWLPVTLFDRIRLLSKITGGSS